MKFVFHVTAPIFLLLFFASAVPENIPEYKGEITGIVQLPQQQSASPVTMGRYRRGGAAAAQTEPSSVLIWVESQESTPRRNEEPVILDQKDIEFVPEILAVRRQDYVRILNSDPVFHNVFSLSSVKRFDVGRRPQGEYLDVQFEREGVVDVFCDIHANMHAVIYVVSPQTYTWTSEQAGQGFALSSLPDGRYSLNIFAPGFRLHTQQVTIQNGAVLDLGTITLSS